MVDGGLFPKSEAGLIGTAFFVCYGVGQVFSGFLGDKVSPFLLIFLGMSGATLTNLAMGFLDSFAALCVVWGLNGLLQSLIWSPLLWLFANVLPENQRQKACVNISTTFPLGTLTSYFLSMVVMQAWGWQAAFIAAAVPLGAVTLLWLFGSMRVRRQQERDSTEARAAAAAADVQPAPLPRAPGKYTLGKLLALSGAVMMMLPIAIQGMLKDGVATWVPTMITETFSVDPSFAVSLSMLLPIASLLGGYAGSFVNRRWLRNEIVTALVFYVFSLLGLIVLFLAGSRSIVVSIAMLALIVFAVHAINIMIITLVPVQFARYGKTSTMTGLLNATAYAGGAASTYGIGLFAERIGWSYTVLLWVALCVVALLLLLPVIRRWDRFKRLENEA